MTRTQLRRRRRQPTGDDGFAVLELAFVLPVLVLLMLLVVGLGRITHGRQLVEQAAAAAARAASLSSSPGRADSAARQEANDTLVQAGISCRSFSTSVDTGAFYPGGQVSVTVTCTADLSQVMVVGFPGALTMTATSVSPLEKLRQYAGGGS